MSKQFCHNSFSFLFSGRSKIFSCLLFLSTGSFTNITEVLDFKWNFKYANITHLQKWTKKKCFFVFFSKNISHTFHLHYHFSYTFRTFLKFVVPQLVFMLVDSKRLFKSSQILVFATALYIQICKKYAYFKQNSE